MSLPKRSASNSPLPVQPVTMPFVRHPNSRSACRSRAVPMARTQTGVSVSAGSSKARLVTQLLLVLLDNGTLEPREMWEAAYADVAKPLAVPGSKARERGALGVPEFKRLARRVWPEV
jgi:hypothetical protein